MLKRNGELCRHKVPDFPGLLTDSEHKAYIKVVEYVKEDIQHCNFRGNVIAEIEKQIPRLKKIADKTVPENAPTFVFRDDKTWKILDVFYKDVGVWELYFCSLAAATEREFSVIQKLYPKSGEITELFGKTLDSFYMARGRNPSLVLDEFLDNQRFTFGIAKKKLEVRIAEDLFKRHSADFCGRVCKAIAPLYEKQRPIENENAPVEKIATGVKMKV
jgi:hypothetical protein